MDFLYANKVRLFRSATEGNILVKIMDINFTPNSTTSPDGISFVFLVIGFSSQYTKDDINKIINEVERTFLKMISLVTFIQSTPF